MRRSPGLALRTASKQSILTRPQWRVPRLLPSPRPCGFSVRPAGWLGCPCSFVSCAAAPDAAGQAPTALSPMLSRPTPSGAPETRLVSQRVHLRGSTLLETPYLLIRKKEDRTVRKFRYLEIPKKRP